MTAGRCMRKWWCFLEKRVSLFEYLPEVIAQFDVEMGRFLWRNSSNGVEY